MTLQEAVQFLSGLGVIASLIYVAIQIRNNARAVRAAAYQQLSTSIALPWAELGRNQEHSDFVLKCCNHFSSLTLEEKVRFQFNLMGYMRGYENGWFQYRIGTLKKSDWLPIAADLESVFATPGNRAMWPLIKNRSNTEFAAYVDTIAAQQAASAMIKIAVTNEPREPHKANRKIKAKSSQISSRLRTTSCQQHSFLAKSTAATAAKQ
jgi:hypothetical protein